MAKIVWREVEKLIKDIYTDPLVFFLTLVFAVLFLPFLILVFRVLLDSF